MIFENGVNCLIRNYCDHHFNICFEGNASPTHDHHGQHEKLSETNLYIRGLSAEVSLFLNYCVK